MSHCVEGRGLQSKTRTHSTAEPAEHRARVSDAVERLSAEVAASEQSRAHHVRLRQRAALEL
jgi:hypothetical protein